METVLQYICMPTAERFAQRNVRSLNIWRADIPALRDEVYAEMGQVKRTAAQK